MVKADAAHTSSPVTGVPLILGDLQFQFSLLLDLLQQEKESLSAGDLARLAELCRRKSSVTLEIQGLEEQLSSHIGLSNHPATSSSSWVQPSSPKGKASPLMQWMSTQSQSDRQKLEPVHTKLKNVMAECRQINAVNGKIVHRSQISVAELMRMINGTASDALYTSQGTAQFCGDATTLAQA